MDPSGQDYLARWRIPNLMEAILQEMCVKRPDCLVDFFYDWLCSKPGIGNLQLQSTYPSITDSQIQYLQQKKAHALIDSLTTSLMKIMPTDPWEHMKSWLSMQRKKDSGSNVPVVIVTGGAGFIGSHTCVELVAAGYDVVVVDSLVNASEESITRVKEITGKPDMVTLFKVDLCDMRALDNVFAQCSKVHAVIHFAGLKAVGESVSKPLTYFENNLGGTFNLLRCMDKYECRRLVFSSSATVYGSAPIPYTETSQVGLGITNPYGRTKFMIEEIVRDLHTSAAGKEWSFVLLRYFNPVGAHPTGKIGEDPDGIPNNLMPYISQVAVGTRASLTIFGGPGNEPYDTPDGTCRRDFIHVVDLAQGHVTAIKRMDNAGLGKCDVYNLGSGKPVSVLELVAAMEKATGKKLSYTIGPRRAGDLPQFWANPDKAAAELNWKTTKTVDEMCADSWSWQRQNPRGFKK